MSFLFIPNFINEVPPKPVQEPPKSMQIAVKSVHSNKEVEATIRQEFKEIPIMIRISKCESHFRQWTGSSVYRGEINHHDIGAFQINETYHAIEAKRMGIDIYSLEGNIKFAKYLYKTQGTTPWNWSRDVCWNKTA